MHARRFRIGIDNRQALPDAGQAAERAAGGQRERTVERINQVVGGRRVAVVGGDVAGRRGKAGGIVRSPDSELRRPEKAVAAANRGLGIHLPGDADAGRVLVEIRIANVDAVAVDSRKLDHSLGYDAGYAGGQRIHRLLVESDHHVVVLLLQPVLAFVAQTDVNGQPLVDANIVLHVGAVVIGELVQLGGN